MIIQRHEGYYLGVQRTRAGRLQLAEGTTAVRVMTTLAQYQAWLGASLMAVAMTADSARAAAVAEYEQHHGYGNAWNNFRTRDELLEALEVTS